MHCSQEFFREENRTLFKRLDVLPSKLPRLVATMEAVHNLRLDSRTFVRLPLHRPNGANGMSDIEGKVTRAGASERGQRRSFKIVCCNFCKGLFLKAAWRCVDTNTEIRNQKSEVRHRTSLYAQSNQKTVP